MPSEMAQVALTTLASGVLAALGAYIGIVWKLSSRVSKLEETVSSLKAEYDKLHTTYTNMEKELGDKISCVSSKQDDHKTEIITSIGILQKDLANFRVTCSDNRSALVRKKEFNVFTEEQEKRWSEFYRLVGRLEGAMDRLSQRPPPLIRNSKNI